MMGEWQDGELFCTLLDSQSRKMLAQVVQQNGHKWKSYDYRLGVVQWLATTDSALAGKQLVDEALGVEHAEAS